MAEIATIARPYAEALFKAGVPAAEVHALAAVAADTQLQQLADNPKVNPTLVFNVISDVLARQQGPLSAAAANFLRTVIANGRTGLLPTIASQLQTLVNASSGVSEATIESAYPLAGEQLQQVLEALQKRFGRKLEAKVVEVPALIGGIRVTVGDEVLDTSVKARLEQMKAALAA